MPNRDKLKTQWDFFIRGHIKQETKELIKQWNFFEENGLDVRNGQSCYCVVATDFFCVFVKTEGYLIIKENNIMEVYDGWDEKKYRKKYKSDANLKKGAIFQINKMNKLIV